MMKSKIQSFSLLACLFGLLLMTIPIHAETIDRIVAIVDEGVILQSEFDEQMDTMRKRLASQQQDIPNEILQKRVLDRMITNSLQLQMAERRKVSVDDAMLNDSVIRLAERNKMTAEEFKERIESEGISFDGFKENLRTEIIINRIQSAYVNNEVKVSENEIEHFLDTQGQMSDRNAEYHLSHILIATPDSASQDAVEAAEVEAKKAMQALQQGQDFNTLAIKMSDGSKALEGGDLGWFKMDRMPTLFMSEVSDMKAGDIRGPIRSPSGFHLIKLNETRGVEQHMMTQTKARHILIKINALVNDSIARDRLIQLKQRIESGDDFATLARAHSEDRGSAIRGGDLGWLAPGALVAPFETAMNALQPGQVSAPVQTQFGWHLIQVIDREDRDNTLNFRKAQARQAIQRRKADEAIQLWLAKLRDEAYIDIRLPQ